MNNLTAKQARQGRKTGLLISAVAGISVGTLIGLKATTVVVGATAAPGAISTTSTVIGGKTMILSKVAAGVGLKIFIGACAGLLIAGIVYKIYTVSTK